jgi:hypothetical protein
MKDQSKNKLEDMTADTCKGCKKHHMQNNSGGAVYGFGVIGALVYFYPQMLDFASFFASVGKSLVWPALLVYEALKLLKL